MESFPPPPASNIDWASLGFNVTEVNGHAECTYSPTTKEWSTPRLIANPMLQIHGLSPGLNYGLQAFEGLKAHRTPNNRIALFRPDRNASRFRESSVFLSIPPLPASLFLSAVHLAVAANASFVPPADTNASLYIRPLIYGVTPQISLAPPAEYKFCVYVTPTGTYHGAHPVDALVLEDYDRAAPVGTGAYKIGGNYAPVFNFSKKAQEEGFGIMLHLDSKTRSEIDEFTTSGFIGVKVGEGGGGGGGVTLVASASKSILKSITSDSVLEIGESLGWRAERRVIMAEELAEFKEVIAAGTAATLVPVRSITLRSRGKRFEYPQEGGEEAMGPITTRLLSTLKGLQTGKVEDSFGWLDYVQAPEEVKGEQSTQ